jgi:hypothetical protein
MLKSDGENGATGMSVRLIPHAVQTQIVELNAEAHHLRESQDFCSTAAV